MVSVWKDGVLQFVRKRATDGQRIPICSRTVAEMNCALGSSDGAIASTADSSKWPLLPTMAGVRGLEINDLFEVWYTSNPGLTLDASDSVVSLPFTIPNSGGATEVFAGTLASANIWDATVGTDAVVPAEIPLLLCAMKVKQRMAFGGGRAFLSTENNA